MRKGTTALRNVQLLKWRQEYHITAEWNILYGFPGETPQDYTEMLQMLPAIQHLRPPAAVGPVRLDRFSPYFNAPEEFGLVNVWPIPSYKYLYPVTEDSLHRTAYYFDYDYARGSNPTEYAADVIRYTHAWQCEPERGTLSAITQADRTLLLHEHGRMLCCLNYGCLVWSRQSTSTVMNYTRSRTSHNTCASVFLRSFSRCSTLWVFLTRSWPTGSW